MTARPPNRLRGVAGAHLALLRLSAKAGLLVPASHLLGTLLPARDVDFESRTGAG